MDDDIAEKPPAPTAPPALKPPVAAGIAPPAAIGMPFGACSTRQKRVSKGCHCLLTPEARH